MERKDLTDNQVTSIMKKVRERVLDAIIPAMNVELERIFGDSLKFSYTTAQNIDAFTSDILFHISALSKSDGICFSLHTQFPDYAISILADRALELYTCDFDSPEHRTIGDISEYLEVRKKQLAEWRNEFGCEKREVIDGLSLDCSMMGEGALSILNDLQNFLDGKTELTDSFSL